MITKMKKLTFLVYHKEYEEFLNSLRELGVVHIVEKQQGAADNTELQENIRLSNRLTATLKLLQNQKHEKDAVVATEGGTAARGLQVLDEVDALQTEHGKLSQQLQGYAKEKEALQAWGNFDPASVRKLKDAGYIKAKGKSLTCTDLGKMLVETFPARELFDLEYTGRLEKTLSDIEKKKFTKDDFLSMIKQFVIESVDKIKNDTVFGGPVILEPLHTEPVGICPECGAPVIETARAFGCSAWKKGCKFAIWKDDRFITSLGKKVSYEMVKILLEHGKVGFRGCVSKRGNKFSAYFYYEKDEKTKRYNWRLEFIDTNPPS